LAIKPFSLTERTNGHAYDTNVFVAGGHYNETKLTLFRKFRFNRIKRQYENVWLWKDVNIGPHGRYLFNLPVPERPAHWMVSAFSVSPTMGFGMLPKSIEVGVVTVLSICKFVITDLCLCLTVISLLRLLVKSPFIFIYSLEANIIYL
jgi:hypothetical protein